MQQAQSHNGKANDAEDRENQTEQLRRQAHDFIRQRPLLALTMALASGYLAGRVLSRV